MRQSYVLLNWTYSVCYAMPGVPCHATCSANCNANKLQEVSCARLLLSFHVTVPVSLSPSCPLGLHNTLSQLKFNLEAKLD